MAFVAAKRREVPIVIVAIIIFAFVTIVSLMKVRMDRILASEEAKHSKTIGRLRDVEKTVEQTTSELKRCQVATRDAEDSLQEFQDVLRSQIKSCQANATEQSAKADEALSQCMDNASAACSLECEGKVKQIEKKLTGLHFEHANTIFRSDFSVLKAVLEAYNDSMTAAWESTLSTQPDQGILLVAGAGKYLINAFVTLYAIRNYWKCSLPVTIMHLGYDWDQTNAETKAFFAEHLGDGLSFVDAFADIPWPPHHRFLSMPGRPLTEYEGWKLKLFAAYAAPYKEILFLDADSTPLIQPEDLFALPEYAKTGAVFWPDTPCQAPQLFSDLVSMGMLRENQIPERDTESGQYLLNRKKHREALEYMVFLATHDDFTFQRAFGDKDLFRAGFALAGKDDAFHLITTPLGFAWGPKQAPPPATEGADGTPSGTEGEEKWERVMRGYVQYSTEGKPLFHHRAGWECKYVLDRPEGRPLEAFSAPLPCQWTRREWPFTEPPGARGPDMLQLVDECAGKEPLVNFTESVRKCASDFRGDVGQKVPLFSVKGSAVENVHRVSEAGFRLILDARAKDPRLFMNLANE